MTLSFRQGVTACRKSLFSQSSRLKASRELTVQKMQLQPEPRRTRSCCSLDRPCCPGRQLHQRRRRRCCHRSSKPAPATWTSPPARPPARSSARAAHPSLPNEPITLIHGGDRSRRQDRETGLNSQVAGVPKFQATGRPVATSS